MVLHLCVRLVSFPVSLCNVARILSPEKMLTDTTQLNVLQLSSSHLNSSSHLGASVPCIPDYVYSQLTPPTVTLSPEGKKIQQDICVISQRGQ